MQRVTIYQKASTIGSSNHGEYTIISYPLNAHIMVTNDFIERQKLGHKLISHCGNENQISAVWEIP